MVDPDTLCPQCRDIRGIERSTIIYRHWKLPRDYVCGYCKALYMEEDGHLVFLCYQWDLK